MTEKNQGGRVAFSGRKFQVRLIEAPTAAGGTARREVVVHPGSVVILAVADDGRIVMIRNRRVAVGRTLWELPAGTMEPPEPADQCALRELREETGYEAARLERLTGFYTTPGFCSEWMEAFTARDLTYVGPDTQDGEEITVALLAPDRLRDMMFSGEIADAKTIAALGLHLLGGGAS